MTADAPTPAPGSRTPNNGGSSNLPALYESFSNGERPTLPTRADGSVAPALEQPRCGAIRVRIATLEPGSTDYGFIDQLQKMHTHMVGWFPKKQMETYIEGGHVLIAEADADGEALGYIIFKDEYKRREDLGIVYQLNVKPMQQRNLIGATLLNAAFEHSAYGCKLYCCWCAQDIQANFFWEACGFVPLGFRTGSRDKQRIHIFWQRRIRPRDTTTPYWFPYKTDAGAVREERLVLPIPPGTHWRDAKPVIVPELPQGSEDQSLPGGGTSTRTPRREKKPQRVATVRSTSKHLGGVPSGKVAIISGGKIKYLDGGEPEVPDDSDAAAPVPKETKQRKRKPKAKHDPEHVKLARDVRDRYLEDVNQLSLPPGACGKWDVSRGLRGGDQYDGVPDRRNRSAAALPAGDPGADDPDIIDAEYEVREAA